MPARFTYSRWDGTQQGFELDGDALFEELTDELLYHGDVNAALRRMMHQGLRDRNGDRLSGVRELLDKLRRERQERLDRFDLGGVYDEIARELDDIVDEERHAIDNARREAERLAARTGDERRAETARETAAERNMRLDFLPNDLAGKVRELQQYDFESAEAARRFEALLDRLRQQLANQLFEQMSGAMQQLTPQDLTRMKDMMAALNEMLERRERGEDPGFEEFMEQYGDFFPENPQSLDELLEQLAQRMAAMQAMLNSMTPEQRAQLQELSDQLLGDMDLRWQMDQLGGHLRQLFPQMGWQQSYDFSGQDPLGFGQAMQTMQDLGDLDQLEHLLRNASNPGALAEADMDRVRDLLGDDAARSLERLAELTRMLTEAGLIEQRRRAPGTDTKGSSGDRLERPARPLLEADQGPGRPAPGAPDRPRPRAHIRHEAVRVRRSVPARPPADDPQRSWRAAAVAQLGTPVELEPDDFEIERTEHLTRSSTVLMLDLSLSMPMRDNFLPAKKVAMALHSLISTQFPRDYLGLVGFSETARILRPEQLPEVSWDFVYGTNMQHGFTLARQLLARQSGTKQIIMITDGEPTAHVTPSGDVFFNYPPVTETVEATLREVLRCTREGILINTFMLDATSYLTAFVERLTEINRGRAFFTTPEDLGDYVLVDFIEHKRQQGRVRRAG